MYDFKVASTLELQKLLKETDGEKLKSVLLEKIQSNV